MKQLKDLPNTNGFKFTGIDLDGERIPCVVKLDPVGNHGVYDQRDGSPCFFRLYGWQPTETQGTRAEAWLYHCWKPGTHAVFASIDENDTTWWPTDKWRGVTRTKLVAVGSPEVIHGTALPSAPVTKGGAP